MTQSSEIKSQIDALLGQINPLLEQLPNAEDYFQKRVNEAYNYNLGPLTNAANIEAKMYSLPGTLMSQYDQEFGGKTGVSANQRINSILGQLGRQGALANTAWGLADQSKMRINDLANSLYNQYKAGIEARQQKLSPLLSIWERMYAEEQANARAARSGGGRTVYVNPWENIEYEDDEEEKKVETVSPWIKKMADSLKAGTFAQDYMGAPAPANTGSTQLDYYINKIKRITR